MEIVKRYKVFILNDSGTLSMPRIFENGKKSEIITDFTDEQDAISCIEKFSEKPDMRNHNFVIVPVYDGKTRQSNPDPRITHVTDARQSKPL